MVRVLLKHMLEKCVEKLRNSGVAAEERGGNEIAFPALQIRSAYPALDDLEAEARTRRLKLKKYLEMSGGVEMQVVGVEM